MKEYFLTVRFFDPNNKRESLIISEIEEYLYTDYDSVSVEIDDVIETDEEEIY